MNNKKSKRAFTLIELLVVATIIVILTAVAVVNYEKANAKSRDGQRKADLTKISLALANYYTDNKSYVSTAGSLNCFNGSTGYPCVSDSLTSLTTSNYISALPTDPINDSSHKYIYKSDGAQYKLIAPSETITSSDSANSYAGAKNKAGDFYDPAGAKMGTTAYTNLQISSSSAAANNW